MADDNLEMVNALAGSEPAPTLADILRGHATGWWNKLGDDMRTQAARPTSELMKDFLVQALTQAPLGLRSATGAGVMRDSILARDLERAALSAKGRFNFDEGVTGGQPDMRAWYTQHKQGGAPATSYENSSTSLGLRPEVTRDPFRTIEEAMRQRSANRPGPFDIVPGGKK